MKVILQENVDGLGYLGDLLDVANGYARNYLLPRGKAVEASSKNVKALEHVKRVTAQKAKKETHTLQEFAQKLGEVSLIFPVQTGKDDKLFGSVIPKDIGDGLSEQGFEIDRRKIQLAQPIKELGTFTVPLKLHRDVSAQISVSVIKKGGDGVEEEAVEPVESHESEVAAES